MGEKNASELDMLHRLRNDTNRHSIDSFLLTSYLFHFSFEFFAEFFCIFVMKFIFVFRCFQNEENHCRFEWNWSNAHCTARCVCVQTINNKSTGPKLVWCLFSITPQTSIVSGLFSNAHTHAHSLTHRHTRTARISNRTNNAFIQFRLERPYVCIGAVYGVYRLQRYYWIESVCCTHTHPYRKLRTTTAPCVVLCMWILIAIALFIGKMIRIVRLTIMTCTFFVSVPYLWSRAPQSFNQFTIQRSPVAYDLTQTVAYSHTVLFIEQQNSWRNNCPSRIRTSHK